MTSHLLKRANEIEPRGPHSLQVRAIEDCREALMDAGDEIFSLISGVASINAKKAAAFLVTAITKHDRELALVAKTLSVPPCPRHKSQQ